MWLLYILEILVDCKGINMMTQLKRREVQLEDKYIETKVTTESWRKKGKAQKKLFDVQDY